MGDDDGKYKSWESAEDTDPDAFGSASKEVTKEIRCCRKCGAALVHDDKAFQAGGVAVLETLHRIMVQRGDSAVVAAKWVQLIARESGIMTV